MANPNGFGGPKRTYELGECGGTLGVMIYLFNHHLAVGLTVNDGVDAVAQDVGDIAAAHAALLQEQSVRVLVHLCLQIAIELPERPGDSARCHWNVVLVDIVCHVIPVSERGVIGSAQARRNIARRVRALDVIDV